MKYVEYGFPTYAQLLEHKRKEKNNKSYYNEFIYEIGQIFGTGYLRVVYNEDNLGCISLDYTEQGFLKYIYIQNLPKNFDINNLYKLNKKNYNLLYKSVLIILNHVQNNINEIKLEVERKYE